MKSLCTAFFLLSVLALPGKVAAQQKIARLGPFDLERGGTIQQTRIGYRTFGQPNRDSSNVILFPTWFGGRSQALVALAAPGGMADSTKYFVIAVDALGNGVSSSPSNSAAQPDSLFPRFTIRDMVRTQHALLTRMLHIDHLFAVMGGSMGGMQTFQWIVSYPGFMRKAVAWVGSPRLTSYDLLLWSSELRAIREGLRAGAPDSSILKTVSAIQTMHLYTPHYRATHTDPDAFSPFMKQRDQTLASIFDPHDWAAQLRAMMAHDVSDSFGSSMKAAARAVRAQLLIIVNEQDQMVNPLPALGFAPLVDAKVLRLDNDCGHLGPSCEMERVERRIRRFLRP